MTFLDLFSGIGGFHIAMHENNINCVHASEIDKFARITYETNFSCIEPDLFGTGNFSTDVTKIDGELLPDFDFICAGFPCQPFSNIGEKRGLQDPRGNLYVSILDIVKIKIKNGFPPKVIILENVKGLKSDNSGATLSLILKELNCLGYQISIDVINTKYFGLPQNRERVFIIAWLSHLNKLTFTFPQGITESGEIIFEKYKCDTLSKKVTVGDILFSKDKLAELEKIENKTYTISDISWKFHKTRKEKHVSRGNGFGYSLVNTKTPYTRTLLARYYKDGGEILIEQDGMNPRILHPIEAARLQGFPSWFNIPVSNTQAYKQFGNSVSIPVVSSIISEVKNQLLQ